MASTDSVLQDVLMVPIHVMEGLASRSRLSRQLYALFAPFYNAMREHCYFGEDILTADVKSHHMVLDLGCGTGSTSRLAATRATAVVGVDLDPGMLCRADRIKTPQGGTVPKYIRADVTCLPFGSETFDACISLGALHCVPYPRVCSAAYRVLKPGGIVSIIIESEIIPAFTPDSGVAALRSALRDAGFIGITELRIGRLYTCIKGRKYPHS